MNENKDSEIEDSKIEDSRIIDSSIEDSYIEDSKIEDSNIGDSKIVGEHINRGIIKHEKSDEQVMKERKEMLKKIFVNKFSWITYIILAIILWVNVSIRTLPMKINPATGNPFLWDITRNNWTLGPDLDPFFFMRWAKLIIEHGTMPAIDTMRYVPLYFDTLKETRLLPYMIAYLYRIIHVFNSNTTVEYAAVILPVIASVFTAIAFFLLVRKIFEEKGEKISNIIALIATAFLITLPSLLSRTIAGIPEKESVGFGLMFFAFYFFIKSWKSNKIRTAFILAILAGLFTALMGLIWGGVEFIYTSLAIAGFIALFLGAIDKKGAMVYLTWLVGSMVFWLPFTQRMTFKAFIMTSSTAASLAVGFFIILYFAMFETKFKENKILKNEKIKKIPPQIFVIIISIIFLVILASIILGPSTVSNMFKNTAYQLFRPYTSRLLFTVAENAQPHFNDWASSFGPTQIVLFGGKTGTVPPLFFWLFILGSLFLFYEMIKKLDIKEKSILIISYILFLFALVFSRASETGILNGETGFSKLVYILGYVILILGTGYVYYKRYKSHELEVFKNIRFDYIFVFSLVFIGIIAARSAVRLIMVLAPIAIIPLAYISVISVTNCFKKKDELIKILAIALAILIVLSSAYTLQYNYKVSNSSAKVQIPSSYTHQWQYAMQWVRENTSENSVFGHWWDYGYWVQTMGERATMLDGGNSIGYWNYLMGRHVLTAESEEEALEVLYNHNVTHFLIDSTEIGKSSAYSNIGSDENYDRYSWIGTFLLDESQTQETSNQTLLIYPGSVGLDEDLIINQDGQEILLPGKATGILGLIVPTTQSENSMEFQQPYALMIYNNQRYKVNLRYLYVGEDLVDFENGAEGCVYIYSKLNVQEQGVSINPIGASMFLSPRNMRALWVRLYLLGEGENFELVHEQSNEIVKSIRNQGSEIPEIVYYQGIQGPIKIWEIHYTGNEQYNEEYVQRFFPESISSRSRV